MAILFHSFIYQPLYNVLVFFYDILPGHDFGLAIILTTLLLKSLFIPLSRKQIESQQKMQALQPKLKEIQRQHKDDKEKQTKAVMAFYKENKVNPFSGCLPLVIQLVFLIAIYRVIISISRMGFVVSAADLYSFVANPGSVNHLFLNFLDLTKPNYFLAFFSAVAQYFQTKLLFKNKPAGAAAPASEAPAGQDFAALMNQQMLYLGPGLTFFIGATFPAALALYWLVSTLFMLGQQLVLARSRHEPGKLEGRL